MIRTVAVWCCVWLAVLGHALTPAEVLVVGNAGSAESVALARAYVQARGIPARNLLLLDTGTGYHMTRAEYERTLRIPMRAALLKRGLAGKIRCLALMWGVPVKIGWQPACSADPDALRAYEEAGERAYRACALADKLLERVGTPPRTPVCTLSKSLTCVFDTPLPEVAARLPDGDPQKPETCSARVKALRESAGQVEAKLRAVADSWAHTVTDTGQPVEARHQAGIALEQIAALERFLYAQTTPVLLAAKIKSDPPVDYNEPCLQAGARQTLAETFAAARWLPVAASARARLEIVAAWKGPLGLVEEYAAAMDPAGYRDAAVDSELALLWHGQYDLRGRQANPLYLRMTLEALPPGCLPKGVRWPAALMTARLDGPTAADARRCLDDSLAVERSGLAGTVYQDAGGKYPNYDAHFTALADLLAKQTPLKVVLDTKPALFAPGSCPDAALYAGWYSLCTYVPAFTWARGAVAWHIASFEAADLRNPATTQWCAKLLQRGVAATFGPVSEPYLDAFPLPEEFLPLLLTGRYTLAECYWRTVPHASWQMTLIGDPLYTPFKRHPLLTVEQLPKGLAGK